MSDLFKPIFVDEWGNPYNEQRLYSRGTNKGPERETFVGTEIDTWGKNYWENPLHSWSCSCSHSHGHKENFDPNSENPCTSATQCEDTYNRSVKCMNIDKNTETTDLSKCTQTKPVDSATCDPCQYAWEPGAWNLTNSGANIQNDFGEGYQNQYYNQSFDKHVIDKYGKNAGIIRKTTNPIIYEENTTTSTYSLLEHKNMLLIFMIIVILLFLYVRK